MINGMISENGTIKWTSSDGKEHTKTLDGGSFINDESSILYMNSLRDKVTVFDENENIKGELSNSNTLYLQYLQKHPRFGISVVASFGDENDTWKDKYMSWNQNEFNINSTAR